ncbi:MAG: hypothetical protein B7X90_01845 [Novosphingobium sp. 17-62-19]|uniref:hypothetical protein n=1 Tax=Novosphingobium sp. 17-62-19 TaxID=1970406 RepID=UPI000BD0673F|nr:hypothetical protein [Novosphingobium sp. 17-62-19]OZA21380.1 MAG: hypothetical protein B7X90_01845 [Novosphingobium sp. 17-62-19]HQS95075.1 hypothetical protein [Novosphingobium sp.]
MTREEFISNAVAWHGSVIGWQSTLSRALDVDQRTIRRAVKDGPTDNVAAALLGLLGDGVPVRVPAEWICGDGSDGGEYLVHTMSPRFLCLVLTEDAWQAFEHQSEGDYQVGDSVLCAFQWIDRRPDNIAMWMERAADALEGFA